MHKCYNLNMKKILTLALFAAVFVACSCPCKAKKDNVANMAEAKQVCKVDSDCTAVYKGCCMCDGMKAVNKTYAEEWNNKLMQDCSATPCTLEMCYVDIDTKCNAGVCEGALKE